MEAEVFREGTLGARISRALERPRAAPEMLAGFWNDEQQVLPEVRLAGWVLHGGLDSAVAAERIATVRAEVLQLDGITRDRYEQAMAGLDRALRVEALAWDEGLMRREVNEPVVQQLNRAGP